MGLKHYKLVGKKVVTCGLMEWASSMPNGPPRVASTEVGGYTVSTIFLGLDHNYAAGPPILWETMVYDPDHNPGFPGIHDIEMDRCAGSWDQAEEMHLRMCAKIAETLGIKGFSLDKPDAHA